MSVASLVVDCDHDCIWSQAFGADPKGMRQLLRSFEREARRAVGSGIAVKLLGAAANGLHRALGAAYGDELEEVAALTSASRSDVLLANLAYDLANAGCSTLVVPTARGPLHARNLDWPFPGQLLRRHTTVVRFENLAAGPYTAVTWPGFIGVLTAVAARRFSVTVNFVAHVDDSSRLGLLKRAVAGHWPVPWAVRQACDACRTFGSAVSFLKKVPLLAPAIFTIAGPRNEERVAVERGCTTGSLLRSRGGGGIFVTNHYQTRRLAEANVGVGEWDTEQRLALLHGASCPGDARAAIALLARPTLRSEITAHQVVMLPRSGECVVRVPGERACWVAAS